MDKNFDLYCAASLLIEASKHLTRHDREFGLMVINKASEYVEQIKIDDELIEEVKEYGRQLQRGIEPKGR
jgi:hypothetical protein